MNLCECGCKQFANSGKRFVYGHNLKLPNHPRNNSKGEHNPMYANIILRKPKLRLETPLALEEYLKVRETLIMEERYKEGHGEKVSIVTDPNLTKIMTESLWKKFMGKRRHY